jgi:hypothetical protein
MNIIEGFILTLNVFTGERGYCGLKKSGRKTAKPIITLALPDEIDGAEDLTQATRQARNLSCKLFLRCCDLAEYLNRDAFACYDCAVANKFDRADIIQGFKNIKIIQAVSKGLGHLLDRHHWSEIGYEIRNIRGGAIGSKPANLSIKSLYGKENLVRGDYLKILGDSLSYDRSQSKLYFDTITRLRQGGNELVLFKAEDGLLVPVDFDGVKLGNSNGHYEFLETAIDHLLSEQRFMSSGSNNYQLTSIGGYQISRKMPRLKYEELCDALPGINIEPRIYTKPGETIILKEVKPVDTFDII